MTEYMANCTGWNVGLRNLRDGSSMAAECRLQSVTRFTRIAVRYRPRRVGWAGQQQNEKCESQMLRVR